MFSKLPILTFIVIFFMTGCKSNRTTQIAENTFVYNSKVYKLIDNELTQVADLNAKDIRKFEILKPQSKSLGTASLSYVKAGASARMDALYRGNFLYFKLEIDDLNDLKENFNPGKFTIQFLDEFGFLLHSTEVSTSDLIGIVRDNNKVDHYEYNGKTEMSTEIKSAIKTFSVSSTVKAKGKGSFFNW